MININNKPQTCGEVSMVSFNFFSNVRIASVWPADVDVSLGETAGGAVSDSGASESLGM